MGCDIHFHVEKQTNGAWEGAETLEPNKYRSWTDQHGVVHVDQDEPEMTREDWFHHRSYALFGMLADVRNGRGFAGVDTGDPVVSISAPRGLPSDVSAETAAASARWGEDGHSHSFFTIAELLAVDWQQPITHRGWVGPADFDRWRRLGKPASWSGGVEGGGIEHLTNAEMAALIDAGQVETPWNRHRRAAPAAPATTQRHVYTRVQWSESWADAAGLHWAATILRMARLAIQECDGDLTRVRAVFWFDN